MKQSKNLNYRSMPSDYRSHFLGGLTDYYKKMYAQHFGLAADAGKLLALEQVKRLQETQETADQYHVAAYAKHPETIGSIWLSRTNTDHAIILWIMVEAPYRHRGYGRQLRLFEILSG